MGCGQSIETSGSQKETLVTPQVPPTSQNGMNHTAKTPQERGVETHVTNSNACATRDNTDVTQGNGIPYSNTTHNHTQCSASSVLPAVKHNNNMGSAAQSNVITILHFNDVYNIEPREQEPVGGAARFTTAVRSRSELNPLVLFSGDAFNPSLMSAVTKGKQMVPILNEIGVHCAVIGNHDFDFGVDTLVKMIDQTTFPWLMSNVIDNLTEEPLAQGLTSHLMDWQGHKLGLLGLVESEWIDTLSTIDPDDITYLDYVEEGRDIARELKKQGAEYIIALTHMRWPNDIRLAEQVEEIDLILGGHDHDYNVKVVNGKYILKSGTDFRQMSQVTLTFSKDGKVSVEVKEVTIDSSIEEEPEVKKVVSEFLEVMGERMETVLGEMEVEMDGRFASIRTSETNLGNFITNVMLECTDAEVAILNSGTLRSDCIHPRGPFKVKDLMSILPMVDPLVVVKVTGKQLYEALENGVSQYPKLEGRFPQVAGISFGFDPDQPPGQRVLKEHIKVQGELLDIEREYKVCTKHYMTEGKDGYDMFKDCPMLVNDEEGPRLSVVVQNHFKAVKVLKGEKKPKFQHRQSIISLNRRKSLARQASLNLEDIPDCGSSPMSPASTSQKMSLSRRTATISSPSQARLSIRRRSSIQSVEMEICSSALAPEVEGRIYVVNKQKRAELEAESMRHNLQKTAITEEPEPESDSPKHTQKDPSVSNGVAVP